MKAHLFRRTRRSQRTRLMDQAENTLQFSEPEQVDAEEWNRVCRRATQRPVVATGCAVFALVAARTERLGVA